MPPSARVAHLAHPYIIPVTPARVKSALVALRGRSRCHTSGIHATGKRQTVTADGHLFQNAVKAERIRLCELVQVSNSLAVLLPRHATEIARDDSVSGHIHLHERPFVYAHALNNRAKREQVIFSLVAVKDGLVIVIRLWRDGNGMVVHVDGAVRSVE